MKLFERNSYVSPGSLGGKIKKYRELRGWSQKELGIRCGFSPSTADVRVAQYENNKKIPREKALKDISEALGLEEYALYDADLLVNNRMFHALFDMEDLHALHPVKKEDGYYLEFSGPTSISDNEVTRWDYRDFLEAWYAARQKYMPSKEDSPEEKLRKAKEYAIWKGEYPMNVAKENTQRLRDRAKMDRLQAEMDALNAKMKGEDELEKIDNALETVLPRIKEAYTPIKLESELIFYIKGMIEKGIDVERFCPEEKFEFDYEHDKIHLISFKTEEILGDEGKLSLYAGFICATETIREYGIDITRRITSKDKELFISYEYEVEYVPYFKNLHDSWKDIDYIIERQPEWPKDEVEKLEKTFREKITGDKDVSFEEKIEY